MVDGFDAISGILGSGVTSIFGNLAIPAVFLLIVVVVVLAYVGVDIVASLMIAGLLALGLASPDVGWLPGAVIPVVLILWGLGLAYYIIMYYNR